MNLCAALALTAMLLTAASAQAGVIIYNSPGSPNADENVLFNLPGTTDTGTKVTGKTQATGYTIAIQSEQTPAQVLATPSGGQSRIEHSDGVTPLNSLSIFPDDASSPKFGITLLEFGVNLINQASGVLELTIDGSNFPSFTTRVATDTSSLALGNGINWFTILAPPAAFITKVTLTSYPDSVSTTPSNIIQDIRQIRVSGVQNTDNPSGGGTVPVPEPSTYLIWGAAAVVSAGAYWARRRKAVAVANA